MKRSLPHIAFALLTLAIGIGVGVYTGESSRVASYEKQAKSLTINSNTMAVVFLDQHGKVVAISPMARKKLGWKDAVGRSAHSFMPGGGQAHQEAFRNTSMQGVRPESSSARSKLTAGCNLLFCWFSGTKSATTSATPRSFGIQRTLTLQDWNDTNAHSTGNETMNLPTEVKARTGTAAEIAAAINADPKFWQELSTDKVWAWLAGGGRLFTLEQFIVPDGSETPELLGLKSAIKAMIAALSNPTTTLDPSPGNEQRALIDAASAAVPIDVSSLIAAGRPDGWGDVTEQQVQDILDAETRKVTVIPWQRALTHAHDAGEEESQKPDATADTIRAAMIAAYDQHANT